MKMLPAWIRRSRSPRVLLALVLVSFSALAQRTAGQGRQAREHDPVSRFLERYEEVVLDPGEVAGRVRLAGELTVATRSDIFSIALVPHDVRAPGYRAEEVIEAGAVRQLPAPPLRTYRGRARGFPDSEARFTVAPDFFEGVILTPGEWYYIEPRRNFAPGSDPTRFVVYRRSDIRPEAVGTCGATLSERIGEAHELLEPPALSQVDGVYMADVATEADYEYVAASGGSLAANAVILDVMNQVDGIYQTQLGIALRVAYQHTWAAPDDPYSSTAASIVLSEFRNYWNANFAAYPYDLAHMWTGKDLDGSTIGIAYLGVTCRTRSYSYGVSQRFSSSPGKYILTAHEIGHNFGAGHTEDADPPQPDCANTIMNSSIGTGANFCAWSRNQVAAHVDQYNACAPVAPAAPSGLTAWAVSSTRIDLAWQDNSTNETGFRVERKTGAGGEWAVAAMTDPDATRLSDTGLAPSTTYYYRVQALSSGEASTYSNTASAATPGAAPTITALLPSSGAAGTAVTITGTNFVGVTAVRFDNTNAASWSVTSPSQILAVVPAGAATGRVSVTTAAGTALSPSDFVVLACSYTVSPLSLAFGPEAAAGSIQVTAGGECAWTAASQASWISVVSGSSGAGDGAVGIALTANASGAARTGTLTVAGRTVTVSQSAIRCDLNADGTPNVLDVQTLVNALLGITLVPAHYDINGDASVNVLDLQRLVNAILGIGSCP